MKDASATGKFSRDKGKRFERRVANSFREIYGASVRRGWQAREGADDADVIGTPFWIECKHHRRVNWRAAWQQASTDCGGSNLIPIAVCHDDGGETVVISSLKDFLNMARQTIGRPVIHGDENGDT